MTKEAALYSFFNGFGIPAYPSSAVPEDCAFPWITYEPTVGSWEQGEIGLTVNLWYYTTDETEPNRKAQELSDVIGYGGVPIDCDDGFIWVKRGTPWCQSLTDDTDYKIKRRYINVTVEYMTKD